MSRPLCSLPFGTLERSYLTVPLMWNLVLVVSFLFLPLFVGCGHPQPEKQEPFADHTTRQIPKRDSNPQPGMITQEMVIGKCVPGSLSFQPQSPVEQGKIVEIKVGPTTCENSTKPEYLFYQRDPVKGWQTPCGTWTTNPVCKWNTSYTNPGTHIWQVYIRRVGSQDAHEGATRSLNFDVTTSTSCSPNLRILPVDKQYVGNDVRFEWLACSTRLYKLWLRSPSGKWSSPMDWSNKSDFIWKADGAVGSYVVQLWSRKSSDPASVLEFVNVLPYSLKAPITPSKCSATVSILPNLVVPQGQKLTVTSNAQCPNAASERSVWIRPYNGSWMNVCSYSQSTECVWDTTSVTKGNFIVQVWIRPVGSASSTPEFVLLKQGTIVAPATTGTGGSCGVKVMTSAECGLYSLYSPIKDYRITQSFCSHLAYSPAALDLAPSTRGESRQIHAPCSGTIDKIDDRDHCSGCQNASCTGYGKSIRFQCAGGFARILVTHLKSVGVKVGDVFRGGEALPNTWMGCTGYSTGPHVHMEVWMAYQENNVIRYKQVDFGACLKALPSQEPTSCSGARDNDLDGYYEFTNETDPNCVEFSTDCDDNNHLLQSFDTNGGCLSSSSACLDRDGDGYRSGASCPHRDMDCDDNNGAKQKGCRGGGVSCVNQCSQQGQTSCSNSQIKTCISSAGCLKWSSPSPCPYGCADSTSCAPACVNQCSSGQTECTNGQKRNCIQSGGCWVWGGWNSCSSGFCGDASSCGSCSNQCSSSQQECSGGRYRTCETGSNNCRSWSVWRSCSSGFCRDASACGSCNHACQLGDTSCSGDTVRICSTDSNGCRVWQSSSTCSPRDYCKNGSCKPRFTLSTTDWRCSSSNPFNAELCIKLRYDNGSKFTVFIKKTTPWNGNQIKLLVGDYASWVTFSNCDNVITKYPTPTNTQELQYSIDLSCMKVGDHIPMRGDINSPWDCTHANCQFVTGEVSVQRHK